MSRHIRILLSVALGAMVVAATVVGVRLWTVHEQTADWALWPREAPSKVQFAGRDYSCGPAAEAGIRAVDGMTIQGRTPAAAISTPRPAPAPASPSQSGPTTASTAVVFWAHHSATILLSMLWIDRRSLA